MCKRSPSLQVFDRVPVGVRAPILGPDGKHPCGDGLVDDLRMILGQQAIIVTVTDEHAIRAHDALIERGVTVFREARP